MSKKKIYSSPEDEVNDRFTEHKKRSKELSESYERLQLENKAQRVSMCGDFLEFKKLMEKPEQGREWTLNHANFCRDRLCPMCNWRRSLKIFGQVSKCMDKLQNDFNFVFLTLTVKNCLPDEIKDTIKHIQKAFNYLTLYKDFDKAFKGFFRTLEVTHNIDNDTYHPHFHIILAVNKSYFKKQQYLSQDRLTELWKKALKVDYTPVIHIEKIRVRDGQEDISAAVAEVSKYMTKSNDYIIKNDIERTDKAVYDLLVGICNVRLCGFGGCFERVRKLLVLDDVENGSLVHVDCEEIRKDVSCLIYRFNWQIGLSRYSCEIEKYHNVEIEVEENV